MKEINTYLHHDGQPEALSTRILYTYNNNEIDSIKIYDVSYNPNILYLVKKFTWENNNVKQIEYNYQNQDYCLFTFSYDEGKSISSNQNFTDFYLNNPSYYSGPFEDALFLSKNLPVKTISTLDCSPNYPNITYKFNSSDYITNVTMDNETYLNFEYSCN